MKINGLGKYNNISDYIRDKIKLSDTQDKNFTNLFSLMFSEKENVMYEYSSGYRIVKLTYGDVYDSILHLAVALKEKTKDIKKGSVIGLYMENRIEWIELFWAIIICGYNPLLMNMRLSEAVLEQTLAENHVSLVISSGKLFKEKTLMLSDIEPSEDIIKITDDSGSEVLIMSSGTSNHIKICAYSAEEFYYQICGSLELTQKCTKLKAHYNGDLKLLTFLPFYHIFGLVAVYIWFAFFSRSFVQLNDLSPQTVLNTIKRHNVTHIFAVPLFWDTIYKSALKTIKSRGEDTYKKYLKGSETAKHLHDVPLLGKLFSKTAFKEIRNNLFGDSVQFMISGGSNISENTVAFFNNIGYRLVNGYGMTEIGITSVELSAKKKYLYNTYVGIPMKFCEYKTDETGELYVRGKATAKYIIEDGVKKEKNDWYATGDIVKSRKGHYYIVSRKDDTIIFADGENLNPFFIESSFNNISGIEESCLIKGDINGETKPVLLVRLENSIDSERIKEVYENVQKTASASQFPKEGRVVFTKMPLIKSDEFKLNRKRLSENFNSNSIVLLDVNKLETDEGTVDELLSEIRSIAAVILNREPDSFSVDDDIFLSIGMTSLEYFSLISTVNERYSANIVIGDNGNYRTLRDIYIQVKERVLSAV